LPNVAARQPIDESWFASELLHSLWVSTNPMGVLSVSIPPFLEDENIFQNPARVVLIIPQFLIQPREPIFELHLIFELHRGFVFPEGIFSQTCKYVGPGLNLVQ
jgi:hypothetical protein